ncbi:hypothetical protein Tco_0088497 [Tanacetum coccineum]
MDVDGSKIVGHLEELEQAAKSNIYARVWVVQMEKEVVNDNQLTRKLLDAVKDLDKSLKKAGNYWRVKGGGDGEGAWFGGSGRSGDGEAFGTWSENSPEKFSGGDAGGRNLFGTWSENSPEKFSGGGGGGDRNPAGGGCRENWERREK